MPLDPPGPFRPEFWRSPLRGPWLTSFLGTLLLPLIAICVLTGLISHGAYQPQLRGNSPLGSPAAPTILLIHLPAGSPSWLYALNQGSHITVGLVAIPLLLAKLWSVIPRLFAWPPVRSPAMALERGSLLLLVGASLFEFATGVLNIQNYYPWGFNFVRAHYYGAWVFATVLSVHVLIKLPVIARAYRGQGVLAPLRADLAQTLPEPLDPDGLVAIRPAAPTLSRRGLLALVGGASLALVVSNLGESLGGPLRRLALLAPRGGASEFPVNKSALGAGVSAAAAGPGWRLTVSGRRTIQLDRGALERLALHTYTLTIGCVEGWSTTQRFTGVRLADLAALAGATGAASLHVESLQRGGEFRQARLSRDQISDPRSLLALFVNGEPLSLDHGYPARIVLAAAPGVHCTKWVSSLSFEVA
jgi:DMSO/TMAO reductase YedYZ molybdopterin-dependent catalytic subunit